MVLFSQAFGINRDDADDWFDPDLMADTKLFVDPMLIWEDTDPRWARAHDRLVEFFNEILRQVAVGVPHASVDGGRSQRLARAERLLRFPEPPEFCLGYGTETIFGRGSGRGLGKTILDAASFAIAAGITEVRHFEELALFGENIGADRISDIVCNVLKTEFIEYTQEVAEHHGVPLEPLPVTNARWRTEPMSWVSERVDLPRNAAQSRAVGVILVPERFLRDLPSLDPNEFWGWAWDNMNEQIRADFGEDIARKVDSRTIMKFARAHASAVSKFVNERREEDLSGYDFDRDPRYLRRWAYDAPELAAAFQLTPPASVDELCQFVKALCEQFKHGVEHRKHSDLLWDRDKLRRESHCQKLFDSTVFVACEASDVDVSPETNGGVGPVDFKFSRGAKRALAELKLAKSSSLERNVEAQVVAYAKTERAQCAYIVIIQSEDRHLTDDFTKKIEDIVARVATKHKLDYSVIWVDARKKPSASKRKAN